MAVKVAVGVLVGRVAVGAGVPVMLVMRGIGVSVVVLTGCKSHQARGGACVGAGVFVGVPVLIATAVPVMAHASGVIGTAVFVGSLVGVIHQQKSSVGLAVAKARAVPCTAHESSVGIGEGSLVGSSTPTNPT